ncbi:cupin domain-containing protein [Candidatus Pelagibacter sp.]|nr:cupin domain-containing protein [Candidatus Pelagibacter sp.]
MKIITIKGKIIRHKKGNIKKFITKKSKEFKGFGECYFSEIKKNQIKGWKKNRTTNQMISVIKGKVKFFLLDDRKKKINKLNLILDENKNYKKIIIPKNVWYAFKGVSDEKSILFNFLSIEHRNTETMNKKFKI